MLEVIGRRNLHGPRDETSTVAVLRDRARTQAGETVLQFLEEDGSTRRLTFDRLDLEARALAGRLRAMGLAGRRAVLLYPPGLEFVSAFFGCLYAGVVAVPADLPRRNRPMPRLAAIVADSEPAAVLTARSLLSDADRWSAQVPALRGLPVLATDDIDLGTADLDEPGPSDRDDLAFLQYTSGSTATPKGVMITHGNLRANADHVGVCFGSDRHRRGVFWLPLYHDMGLIGGVLQTVDCGGSSLLMSPVAFLQRPVRWLEAISRTGAAISGGPDFAYDLCARKIGPEQKAGLDLSRWSVAFNGAEPVRAETLDRFAEAFAPCGFRREAFLPCYGLAESTLLVSGLRASTGPVVFSASAEALSEGRLVAPLGVEDARRLVSSGGTPPGVDLAIVDPKTLQRLPDGRVGEVWARGASVAKGYWRRPRESRETFGARIADDDEGPYLRTGDLGALRRGELYVTGRLKDLIILRGRNVYPQDIEWSATAGHPSLRAGGAAAFAVEIGGQERVVVVAEVERVGRETPAAEIIEAIRRSAAEGHELDLHAVVLLRPMGLPRTSSGKVRRRACREAYLGGSLEALGSWTKPAEAAPGPVAATGPPAIGRSVAEIEAWLTSRVAGILRVPAAEVDSSRPITSQGLDSLSAMELRSAIEADLGVEFGLTTLLEGPSVAEIAALAAERLRSTAEPTVPASAGPAPAARDGLSENQRSLWCAHHLSTNPGVHNITGAAVIRGEVDVPSFRRAIQRVVDRHEGLRSRFPAADGRPTLDVRPSMPVNFRHVDASGWTDEQLDRARDDEARRPFDLDAGPLHRLVLWTRTPTEHVVLIGLHHIVGDFWTVTVILDDFAALYRGEQSGEQVGLTPLTRGYADFVAWQARKLGSPAGERLSTYWKARLTPPPPGLDLPTDRPRPASRSQAGSLRTLKIDEGLTGDIARLADSHGASLYATLLAALQVLLARYSGQEDITVGSPVAGRTPPGMEGVVGYFVNLVPMRSDLGGNPTFEEFLGRVRTTVHEGLEHQDYPFGRMVEGLSQALDPSRTPIFSVMFVYQKAQRLREAGLTPFALSTAGHRLELAGMPMESLSPDKRSALFDLTLMAALGTGGLSLAMESSADLFDPPTIDRMLGHYRTLLRSIVARPGGRIDDLSILDESEQHQLLERWSAGAGAESPRLGGIHDRFEAQAARAPSAVAVVAGGERLTYGGLDEQADRVASRLRQLGVGVGRRVGLCAGRSPRLWAGVLGILKAGGAYVALDPSHPRERSAFVLRDAGVDILLVDRSTREAMRGLATTLVDLDGPSETAVVSAGRQAADPGDPAYLVYTSGSTGVPKGVVVSHGGLAAALDGWESAYGLSTLGGPHLQMAGVAFDVFTGDWARALCTGATLVACPREALLDPEALVGLMARERVAAAEFVPSVVEGVIAYLEDSGRSLPGLRLVAVGSDTLNPGTYGRLRRVLGPGTRVVNSYGLTEATIDSTYFEGPLPASTGGRSVPIGLPFAGTTAYVLDQGLRPLATGLPGELYIGGPGVAIGYLGRPGLTAERFVPDPFSSRPGSRLYKTGDTARWLADGNLGLVGRADGQVKIRGQRVELGEVESSLRRDPSVRDAAVIVREGPERRLAAFVVAEGDIPIEADLRRRLRERLPEVMVPSTILVLDTLPLSANGKVDRRALAAIEATVGPRSAPQVAPRNEVESTLARIAAGLLGEASIGVEEDLLGLGIDSIQIIQLVSRARAAGLAIDPMQVFRRPTIAGLAATARPVAPPTVDPRTEADRDLLVRTRAEDSSVEDAYDLTPVQQGMLFHVLLEPEAGAYVEQFRCVLRGEVDADAFASSWRRVVQRHPALRSAIRWVDADRPVQVVLDRVELPFILLDWTDRTAAEQAAGLDEYLREDRRRGFVLTFAPPLRLALFRLDADRTALVWTVHHLVMDGWCLPILLGEALATYQAEARGEAAALPPPRPFREYLAWLGRQDHRASEPYWRRALGGLSGPTPLGIEASSHEKPLGVDAFAECENSLGGPEWAALRAMSRSGRVTLGTIVQGAWALLLSRYSGRADVVFGVTVSGRPAELDGVESIVGVLINTLPMRVAVAEEAAIVPWLAEVQARQAEMRRHESTPLTLIQSWSDVPRGRPLFESVVILQNTPVDVPPGGRLTIEGARVHEQTNYSLTLSTIPGDVLTLRLGYDARRFEAAAVDRALGHLRALLVGFALDPGGRLADLTLGEDDGRWAPPGDLAVGPLSPAMIDRLSEAELDAYLAEFGIEMGSERP